MCSGASSLSLRADEALLTQIQAYLAQRGDGLRPSRELETVWQAFYASYSRRIHSYALHCGAPTTDVLDCVQEVWRELLVRLPVFHHDAARGQFDSWLFAIVRSKATDLRRRTQRETDESLDFLTSIEDRHVDPTSAFEEQDTLVAAWNLARTRLSDSAMRVLQLRLVENQSVAQVAEKLQLSVEQVWYRYHRARRDLGRIGAVLTRDQASRPPRRREFRMIGQVPAQGREPIAVSPSNGLSALRHLGGGRVDYVFQLLELGRRELGPEWKVEWLGDCLPTPTLYIRKMAIVAYAEICGPSDLVSAHWPQIANAALAAGGAAGIATIIATPTAAIPVFRAEFHRHLRDVIGGPPDARLQIALSTKQDSNGLWSACKD
jgi:RNA polymerase sigma factor (sigma-70 family)